MSDSGYPNYTHKAWIYVLQKVDAKHGLYQIVDTNLIKHGAILKS